MSKDERRVVVTGIGLLTGLGEGVTATWDAIVAGRSAVGPLRRYDPTPLRTRIGAEILDFEPTRFLSRRALRMVNRGDQMAVAAATLALRDAGIDKDELGFRTALYLGGNKDVAYREEVLANLAELRRPDGTMDLRRLGETAAAVIPPLSYVEGMQPASVFHVSQIFGIRGPSAFLAGTADAGAMAIGRAMRVIRRGDADVAIAGGFDDATTWWSMSKMDGLGVLTTRNDLGDAAFRPYDRQHSGAVLGDGGAVLVLEERARAVRRGVRCYAEVIGCAGGNDATRPPTPHPRGRGLARAINYALKEARIDSVDYVAAHGCATPRGDASEACALHDALAAAARRAQISSVKPQTGHLVGGAGALNVAVAALALHTGVAPATRNLETVAPDCDLDWIPGDARQSNPATALGLARGLEGQAVAVALAEAG
jgi:3-oxoacyl-[acyl-carrier-protein] synthase II